MLEKELLAVLRLQSTPNVGDIISKKLVRTLGSATQIFQEKKSSLLKIDGIGEYTINNLLSEKTQKLAAAEFNYIEKHNIQYSYCFDEDYPKNLKNCQDAPLLFFHDGNLDWHTDRIISIVGTRNMTNYGKEFCRNLIESIAVYDPLIVSGLAYGVDICAHQAAMDHNLQTIAVLAHGLNEIYPKKHKQFLPKIMDHGGLISEFWHNEQPMRENFLKRNRIVAGISKATIVIESAERGGALVTADIANSYHRDVFAVPGKTSDYYSKGCNNLIKTNQAHLLTSADDIIKMLNWDVKEQPVAKQTELFITLSEIEQKVYDYLLKNGKQLLDLIAVDCEIPVYKLSGLLIEMELKGIIKPLPGKMFEV